MKYTIYPDGVVHAGITFTSTDMKAADTEVSEATLMATFTPGQDAQRLASSKLNVPRIGVRFHLPSDMNQVEYFGRGPGETTSTVMQAASLISTALQPTRCTPTTMSVHKKTDTAPTPVG